MIDASTFAAHHNAFWASYTPTSEHFVRRVNLEYADRWTPPLDKPHGPIRAAYVAELAFARMCVRLDGSPIDRIQEIAVAEAKSRLLPLLEDPLTLDGQITEIEQDQVSRLEESLFSFFTHRGGPTTARPPFSGCGYIDTSEADILSGKCLFEVKAVDRPFRSVDVRQLITYCALNHVSGDFELEAVGIFNPRRGIYFQTSIENVAYETSGLPAQELFDTVIHAISSGDISR